jgi:hypothetical protein
MLRRFGPDDEVLAGDLVEEFHSGRSRFWVWTQVIAAIASARHREREIRPLRLVEDDSSFGTIGRHANVRRPTRQVVNITASPIVGIGGLGLVALGALVTIVVPEIWWAIAIAMCGGVAIGITRVLAIRHRRRL